MPLIYAGIDEAGYGPMLGPLCVGASIWSVEDWAGGDPAPDLWERLGPVVARAVRGADGRLVYADSKKLKLSNSLKTKHPLTHLERGVLGSVSLIDDLPGDDEELLRRFGACYPDETWYGGDALPLPLAWTPEQIRIAVNPARLEMNRAGVRPLGVIVRVVGEREFNDGLRSHGGKAGVVGAQVSSILREIMERFATPADAVRVVCDRQSGRTDYLEMVRAGLGAGAEELDRSAGFSRYAAGRTGVLFVPGAEARHLPVALASMAAKYTRELAMLRFNRWWGGRATAVGIGLKPTAGYVQDARRWLEDARTLIERDERVGLVRRA